MRYSKRKIFFIGLIVMICVCMLWTMRPVKIIRAGIRFEYDSQFKQGLLIGSLRGFTDNESYDVIVDHMPLTEWGRIHWYLDHKDELKGKYNIPTSSSYHIAFWDVGDGFIDGEKSGDGDLVCFNKVDGSNQNCVEKDLLLSVDLDKGEQEEYTFKHCCNYWSYMPNGRLAWFNGYR